MGNVPSFLNFPILVRLNFKELQQKVRVVDTFFYFYFDHRRSYIEGHLLFGIFIQLIIIIITSLNYESS